MAKELKNTAIFGGKKYIRSNDYYKNKESAKKTAKLNKKIGLNSIVDKNKKGYFLWIKQGHMWGKKSKKKLCSISKSFKDYDTWK